MAVSGMGSRMIDKVLVPIDGSRHAEAALDFALDVAVHYEAAVCLQHVMTPSLSAVTQLEGVDALPQDLLEQVQQAWPADQKVRTAVGQEILARTERRAAAFGFTRVCTRLDDGDVVQEILTYAEHEKVGLIVTGSRGLGLMREIFIGSVSSKLLHLASCPLCIVKLPKEPSVFGKLQQLS